jgi:hypothetical protein
MHASSVAAGNSPQQIHRAYVRAIVSEELRPIRAELADIRRELDDLRSRVANIAGYGREIDHALERIAAIEKHLGIGRKAAA